MDGLVTLRELRARGHTMPVIMCSSLTQRGARVTIEALASGRQRLCGQAQRPSRARSRHPGAGAGTDSQNSRAHLPRCKRVRSCCGGARVRCCPSPRRRHPRRNHLRQAVGARHRRLHRRPGGARRAAPGAACRLSPSGSHRAAHARSLYPLARRTPQPPLRLRVRKLRKATRHRRRHLYCARQLAHGSATRGPPRRARHPSPHPGPAGEPLPSRRRHALSLHGACVRLRRARRGAYRHGI